MSQPADNQSHSETAPAVVIETPAEPYVDICGITDRLRRRPDWRDTIEPLRSQMVRECRKVRGMTKAQAQDWTYTELDRLYPPEPPKEPEVSEGEVTIAPDLDLPEAEGDNQARAREGRIAGLADVPPDWPPLPSNASLAAEVSWVQSNRLAVVEEQPSGSTVVHLDHARSPAPSWAALGWLETSIRSYAKYVDVAAKATAQQEDEREHVRREKLAIEEVRSLLAEMLEDG